MVLGTLYSLFQHTKQICDTWANASTQVEISLLVTWDITKLMVFAVSAVFMNLGPGEGALALKNKSRTHKGMAM